MFNMKSYKPKNEKELHSFISQKPSEIEEDLEILKYEMEMNNYSIDFLCLDRDSKLVIIEVKLNEDDKMLWQAMGYYNEIEKKRYKLVSMFREHSIDPNKDPRIILISSSFSNNLKRMCNHVKPVVDLFTYRVFKNEQNQLAINLEVQDKPQIETTIEIPKTEDHRNFLTNNGLKNMFDKTRTDIQKIDKENLNEYATKSYLAFSFRNKILCGIITRRNSFYIFVNSWNENFTRLLDDSTEVTIKNKDDDYSLALEKIEKSLEEIKNFYRS